MNRFALPLASSLLIALSASVSAAPGGHIGTLPLGEYVCELPGDAGGPAGHKVPHASFNISANSTYHADGRQGLYLLTGKTVTMTSGPRKGQRYIRQSRGFLRQLDDTGPTALRCILQSPNNR